MRSGGGATPSAIASSSSAFSRASVDRKRCSAAASSGLGDEPIPDATNGFDPTGFLERAAQLVCGLLDAVLETLVAVAPHMLEQLSAGDHLALTRREHLEHQQWPAFELQGLRFQKRLAPRCIDSQATSHQDSLRRSALAQRPANPGQKDLAVRSLGDVVGR